MVTKAYAEYLKQYINDNRFRYLIRTFKKHQPWLFQEIDETVTEPIVYWTLHKRTAFLFVSEEEVEEFKMDFIKPRKSDIIRIDVAKNPEILIR